MFLTQRLLIAFCLLGLFFFNTIAAYAGCVRPGGHHGKGGSYGGGGYIGGADCNPPSILKDLPLGPRVKPPSLLPPPPAAELLRQPERQN